MEGSLMASKGTKKAVESIQVALACGATIEAAARAAGVNAATVYRRLKEPDFCQRVQQLRSDMVQRTSGVMIAASTEAVKTLINLMKPDVPAAVRLGAAKAVIELSMRIREVSELDTRMLALETLLGEGS